jgi:excisionase family DNA binding protein
VTGAGTSRPTTPRQRRSSAESRGKAGSGQVQLAELPLLLDIAAVAERLCTTERHVRRLVDEKRIPYLKVGHFVRFDAAEVARWLETCRVGIFDRESVSHRRWYHGQR